MLCGALDFFLMFESQQAPTERAEEPPKLSQSLVSAISIRHQLVDFIDFITFSMNIKPFKCRPVMVETPLAFANLIFERSGNPALGLAVFFYLLLYFRWPWVKKKKNGEAKVSGF